MALALVTACGPSTGREECTREDVVTSGMLVMDPEWEECSQCDLTTARMLVTLETNCEAGVEWEGSLRLIEHTSAVNLVTQERFDFEVSQSEPTEQRWRVEPSEPLTWPGPKVDRVVSEPGDYAFTVEFGFDLMAAEFEGSVE